MRTRAWAWAISLLLVGVSTAACDAGEPTPPPQPDPTGSIVDPVELDFLAYGPDAEVAAYETMVERFNREHPEVQVTLQAAANQNAAYRAITDGDAPDIFLLSRRDLIDIAEAGINQPIDELLDSRGVDFGDFYKRDALLAFSLDNRLQCMPYGASPMVMYYNTELVNFEAMESRELPVPSSQLKWSFEEFAAAAQFAARRPKAKGVHIEPSLHGLAPFIYSGGGQIFDDTKDPTTLTLSEESSREALDRTLQLLRRDRITLTPRQLRDASALSRFKDGRLGMIAGFRTLVPELRKVPGLSFDVMPMPTLDSETTVGDVTGICLSGDPSSVSDAADFIVHAISAESVAEVAEAGYLVPANNEVAESDAFLQPALMPAHAEVFNRGVRDIVVPPLLESFAALEEAIHQEIYRLFFARVIDIEELTTAIDEASREIIGEQRTEPGETQPNDDD